MTVSATCQGCLEPFEARRADAKWCSDRCRKAATRRGDAAPAPEPSAPAAPEKGGLVESVRKDLEAAGRVHTFAGQLALQLAQRLSNPDETGISSLSKELRTVMAAALEGVTPPSAEGEPAAEDDDGDDEVTRARRQREQSRQAAGLA